MSGTTLTELVADYAAANREYDRAYKCKKELSERIDHLMKGHNAEAWKGHQRFQVGSFVICIDPYSTVRIEEAPESVDPQVAELDASEAVAVES